MSKLSQNEYYVIDNAIKVISQATQIIENIERHQHQLNAPVFPAANPILGQSPKEPVTSALTKYVELIEETFIKPLLS